MILSKMIKKLFLTSFLLPVMPIISVPDDGQSGNDNNDKDDKSSSDENKDDKSDDNKENKEDTRVIFGSQEEFDQVIQARVNRAVKKAEETNAANKAKENMTEVERIKAEKAESDKRAVEATNKANKTLIKAEVISQATKLNIVDPSAAFALMDTENVSIDDNGNVKGVSVSLKALIKDKPYLIKSNVDSVKPSGDDQNAGSGKKKKGIDMNTLIRRAAGHE